MSRGLLAFAAGVGGGYLDQKRQNELDDERKADRANRQQEFDARMDEVKQAKALRVGLADAARPATVNENAMTLDVSGKPAVYEDAGVANSDYRQARTMGLADVQAPKQTASVNGKAYSTTGEADAAAVAYNQPDARTTRLADAYMAGGQPMQAMQLGSAAQAQKSGAMDMQAKQQKAADELMRRDIQKPQNPEEWADFLSKSKGDGQNGAMKVQPRYSADRKMVTYDRIKPDGSLEPTGMEFENSPMGMEKTRMTAAGYITPEMRMAHYQWETEQGRKVKADDQKFEYQKGRLDNQSAMNDIREKSIDSRERMGLASIVARGARGGGGSDSSGSKFTNAVTAADRALTSAENSATKRFPEISVAESISPKEVEAYTAKRNAAVDADPQVQAQRKRVAALREKEAVDLLGEEPTDKGKKPGLSDAKPSAPATPAGMTLIGKTPDGRMVYRTKDGKKVVGN